jgi:Tol biopolymer transport system component
MPAALPSTLRRTTIATGLLGALLLAGLTAPLAGQQPPALRPMTFLDMQHMRQTGAPTPGPDGKWLLYTLSTPDWKEGTKQTDIFVVSLQQGVSSTRQLTFTKDKNETSPKWAADGSFFVFLSDRDAPEDKKTRNQLYMMRPDGGEARRLTDAKEGISDVAFTRDGRWLAYRTGKDGEEQLYRLSGTQPDSAPAEPLSRHPTGVRWWHWAPDGTRIYFVTPDAIDPDERTRREKRFTVNIRNPETPVASLWVLNVSAAPAPSPDVHTTTRLTPGGAYSVDDVTISKDGKWVGFRGLSANRYQRGIRSLSARGRHRHDRTVDLERRSRRRQPQLLARQPVGGILGPG